MPIRLVAVLMVVLTCGCTHVQLRKNTIRQSETLTDIYEQQVLDNLAMFASDPGALPFFAFPNQGGTDVTDSFGADGNLSFSSDTFTGAGLAGAGGRGMSESWTLTPVYDARRLELMRAAYQQVMLNAGCATIEDGCPDNDLLLRQFYTGTVAGESIGEFTQRTGRTTPACFQQCKWFGCGPKPPKHKNSTCCKVGGHCGTYVWLLPGGQRELTKLTLVILDFAFNDAAAAPPTPVDPPESTVNVTKYFSADGQPTTKEAAHEVRTEVVAQSRVVGGAGDGMNIYEVPMGMKSGLTLPPLAPANTNVLSPRGIELQQRYLQRR
nr:hypothetical protein [Rhodopirellula sp. SM50]